MKVVALFQIYLPYFLPRMTEWSAHKNFQFQFDIEGHLVNVRPRRADEDLFPSPIDENLAKGIINVESETIIPVGAPSEIPLRYRIFDRVEAQVYGEVDSADDCLSSELATEYRKLAISGCDRFLYLCRLAARDPDITGLTWHYDFENDRCHFEPPHTIVWFDTETNEPLRDAQGRDLCGVSGGSVMSPVRVPLDFQRLMNMFDSSNGLYLPLRLLVSAKGLLIANQLHEGIVNLASACEIVSTQYVERKGMAGDPQVKKILRMMNLSFAERRFRLLTLHIDKRSLKADDPDAFDLLEKAYKTRNSLAHTGELAYKDPASGNLITVTRSMANDFFKGCERGVDWVEGL
jgi:hypothetical protein